MTPCSTASRELVELLEVAADTVKSDIVAAVAADRKVGVLMIHNAMRTAIRELELRPSQRRLERSAILALLDPSDRRDAERLDGREAKEVLRRKLRDGECDAQIASGAAAGIFFELARHRCEIDAPKAIRGLRAIEQAAGSKVSP